MRCVICRRAYPSRLILAALMLPVLLLAALVAGEHWRVDWLFSPAQAGGLLQVFIYAGPRPRMDGSS